MDFHTLRHVGWAVALAALTTSCIDSNYDLSDINTDASFSVNNLTLPLNIDKITLDNIFDLDSTSKIKVINNEYVFVSDGDFASDDITIGQVVATTPDLEPSKATLPLTGSGATRVIAVPALSSGFTFSDSSVSSSIHAISEAAVDFTLKLRFTIPALAGKGAKVSLTNLKVNLPKGWIPASDAGTYNASQSTLIISSAEGADDHTVAADVAIVKVVATDNFNFNADTHTVTLSDKFGIAEATLNVNSSNSASLPSQAEVILDYIASPLTATAFSGEISYNYTGLDVEPITLDDIPDLLTQPGTNISIANPQLYIRVENPLYVYSLQGRTGLTLNSIWPNGSSSTHTLDHGTFNIPAKKSNPFCLSPSRPSSYYTGFDGATYVPFTSFANVLSGDGLPSEIDITLNDAEIYTQHVTMLPLGKNLGKFEGVYTIFAPLALNAGSTIIYNHTETGWNDEDVDAITITKLKVTANLTSDLPANVHIVAFPLGKDGKIIPGTEIQGADISGTVNGEPIEITLIGEVTHLDGIEIQAIATSIDPNVTLSPEQSIILTNLKATVTGNYTKKL